MNMNRSQQISQKKYVILVTMLAAYVSVPCIIIASYASLMQTISAFKQWEDPTLKVNLYFFVLNVGLWLPTIYGALFQYGQNVALALHKHYGTDVVLFTIPIPFFDLSWEIRNKEIFMGAFVVCAFIDALTNLLWFNGVYKPTGEKMTDLMSYTLGNLTMILLVFIEEVLGWVLQAAHLMQTLWRAAQERSAVLNPRTNERAEHSTFKKQQGFKQTGFSGFQNIHAPIDPNDEGFG